MPKDNLMPALTYKPSATNTRREFLKFAAVPASSLLLTACGGGAEEVATTTPTPSVAPAASPSPTPAASPSPTPAASPSPTPAASPSPTPAASPAAAPAPSGPVPAWVSALPLWHWHEIPNTALSSVDPAIQPLGITGPRSKIEAWCGASLKRQGSVYMLGAAGGHADYAGNEVNALKLNTATPQWVQSRAPSSNTDIINLAQFYLDHKPAAAHTYYNTQFIESLNRMMVFASGGMSGSFPPAPGGFPYMGDKRSFSFNLSTNDWDSPDYVAQFPGDGDSIAALCVKHPWTDDVYYSRSYGTGWYRWTRSTNTWAKLSNASRAPWYAGAAIDPLRNRMLVVGGYSASAPLVLNLDGTSLAVNFSGLGASALTLSGYPGIVYDESLDRYVVAFNSGNSIRVLRVHPETWLVDEPSMTGNAPASRLNGVLNAIQYAPELRGVVVANKHNGNVFFARTSA